MASQLTEDEIDDLLYAARTGDNADLTATLSAIAARIALSPAEILLAARDESKATCLHMATGNGHLGTCPCPHPTPNVREANPPKRNSNPPPFALCRTR